MKQVEREPAQTEEAGIQERILDAAQVRFRSYGYSKVTMEELAQDLGISKKTLYKHFKNKEEVLRAVARRFMELGRATVDATMLAPDIPFLEKLKRVLGFVGMQSALISPQIIKDIATNSPSVWKELHEFRAQRIQAFAKMIREGIHQGVLRDDLDEELVMKIYFGAIQSIIDPQSFAEAKYTPQQALTTLIAVLFEGMLTPEGRKNVQS